ncbi:MAG: pentapeptide repeat-containing protein [Methylococcales bacterium]|nr:pentapeptide repeat-containing protein [Methylococcales bacterium]
MNEKSQLDRASHLLSVWGSKITLQNAIDFNDINKISEGLAANLSGVNLRMCLLEGTNLSSAKFSSKDKALLNDVFNVNAVVFEESQM